MDIKQKTNPLLRGIPKHLKDPANYVDIKQKIWATMQTACTHSDIHEMAVCDKCTKKMLERRRVLKQLGFKNPAQYREWDKTHTRIRKMYPLVNWEKREFQMPNI